MTEHVTQPLIKTIDAVLNRRRPTMQFHHQLKRSDLLESTLHDSEGFIRKSTVTRVSDKVPLAHTMDMAERFLEAVARD